jgi:fructose transport system ATP-binding protein
VDPQGGVVSAAMDVAADVAPAPTSQLVLEARGLVKHYGRVVALDHADFELRSNEILGVIGDNGAGKSTLIKVLAGAITADAGQVLMDGQVVQFRSPIEARKAGIETVYQNLALSPARSRRMPARS